MSDGVTPRGTDADLLIRLHSSRVLETWLTEFGYTQGGVMHALEDRDMERLNRELSIHAKRLADRAQMVPGRVTGRAGVIR